MEECEERTWDWGMDSHHCRAYGYINANNNCNNGRCSEVRKQTEHPGKLPCFSWAGIWCIFMYMCVRDKEKTWGGRSRKRDAVDNLKVGVRVIQTWAWCWTAECQWNGRNWAFWTTSTTPQDRGTTSRFCGHLNSEESTRTLVLSISKNCWC